MIKDSGKDDQYEIEKYSPLLILMRLEFCTYTMVVGVKPPNTLNTPKL